MSKASRDKGIRGELEVRDLLRSWGWDAVRGRQHKGTPESPDVICENFPFHIEVKRVEKLSVHPAVKKVKDEAGNKPAAMFHRKNGSGWLVTLTAEDFLSACSAIIRAKNS